MKRKNKVYIFKIVPVGKPRMTQRDKWNPSLAVQHYWTYKDELKLKANLQQYKCQSPLEVFFYLPMPKSWSNKKRQEMLGLPHEEKPDGDNLVKAFIDALLKDDRKMHDVHYRKFWSVEGRIEVLY